MERKRGRNEGRGRSKGREKGRKEIREKSGKGWRETKVPIDAKIER